MRIITETQLEQLKNLLKDVTRLGRHKVHKRMSDLIEEIDSEKRLNSGDFIFQYIAPYFDIEGNLNEKSLLKGLEHIYKRNVEESKYGNGEEE